MGITSTAPLWPIIVSEPEPTDGFSDIMVDQSNWGINCGRAELDIGGQIVRLPL